MSTANVHTKYNSAQNKGFIFYTHTLEGTLISKPQETPTKKILLGLITLGLGATNYDPDYSQAPQNTLP